MYNLLIEIEDMTKLIYTLEKGFWIILDYDRGLALADEDMKEREGS
jgi:hypothetical protein